MADDGASAKGMDSVDTSNELGRLASRIIPHILNLYNCKSTALDYEIYAPNAEFEDPLMQAHGVAQIKSAFYAIPKVFSEGKMVEFTVEEEETTSGSGEIRMHNLQHYKVLGKEIDMKSLIKLQVEDGKIVRHEDLWDENPLWNRKTVSLPLVGWTAETWRRMNMLVTHVLMGFGKDQRPVN
ncbi:hypothetical protein BDL97_11G064900 [Sphagnum fallax]|jgi:ketosteroid isomerase-like protein|nr:hypothetical protein BDL97_11G064900 [Sphagnum fallax]